MQDEVTIRQLAKSTYWQNLYRTSKQNINIQFFDNNTSFSGPQVLMFYWLDKYNTLYDELAQKEWDNLSLEVIYDDVSCDAFLYYRRRQLEQRMVEYKREKKKQKTNSSKKNSKIDCQSHNIYTGPQKQVK